MEAKTLWNARVEVPHSAQYHHPNNKSKPSAHCRCLLTRHRYCITYIPWRWMVLSIEGSHSCPYSLSWGREKKARAWYSFLCNINCQKQSTEEKLLLQFTCRGSLPATAGEGCFCCWTLVEVVQDHCQGQHCCSNEIHLPFSLLPLMDTAHFALWHRWQQHPEQDGGEPETLLGRILKGWTTLYSSQVIQLDEL